MYPSGGAVALQYTDTKGALSFFEEIEDVKVLFSAENMVGA